MYPPAKADADTNVRESQTALSTPRTLEWVLAGRTLPRLRWVCDLQTKVALVASIPVAIHTHHDR